MEVDEEKSKPQILVPQKPQGIVAAAEQKSGEEDTGDKDEAVWEG